MQHNEDFYINRKKKSSHLGGEDGESWAVSYSDLLMVLMSFFIVFFNMEEEPVDSGLTQLIYTFHEDSEMKQVNPKTGELIEDVQSKQKGKNKKLFSGFEDFFGNKEDKSRKISSLSEGEGAKKVKLTNEQIQKLKEDNSTFFVIDKTKNKGASGNGSSKSGVAANGLMIDFSSNMYGIGEYNLSDKSKDEIKVILEKIKPLKNKFNLVFIGHSDQIPMAANKKVIDSNLILSSLRAAKAVEYAIMLGYDPIWVSAQGVGEYSRNSRSLSLRVMER